MFPPPDSANNFHCEHTELMRASFLRWTGCHLVDAELTPIAAAKVLFRAPFALLSHDASLDPILTYGNAQTLALFEMTWEELSVTSSRLTAEAPNRAERERMLTEVAERGFIDDYAGVRISRRGRRFRIDRATVWNLNDATGRYCGQAAMFSGWVFL